MNEFRIIQTQSLSSVLPYEVQECKRVWYSLRPVWRPLLEKVFVRGRYRTSPRRFQTPQEAQLFTEQLLTLRAQRNAEQAQLQEEQRQRCQLPRVIQVLSLPA
jgi:hypothetical protein